MPVPNRLSKDATQRAVRYVESEGRPLDRAVLAEILGGGSGAAVVRELARFQNADGGFFGMEPDLRLPASHGIATAVATGYLRAAGARGDDPVVVRALAFLERALDRDALAWPTAPAAVNDVPHAPWWTFDAETGTTQAGSDANPTAELAAAFLRFDAAPAWLAPLVARLLARLAAPGAAPEMHDFVCYLSLYAELPTTAQPAVQALLAAQAVALVARDPADWAGYGVKPLLLAPTPASPAYAALAADVERNLDWEIAQQGPDGSWGPNWSWFGAYPDVWPAAEREWRGILTVRMLRCLKDHGRLA